MGKSSLRAVINARRAYFVGQGLEPIKICSSLFRVAGEGIRFSRLLLRVFVFSNILIDLLLAERSRSCFLTYFCYVGWRQGLHLPPSELHNQA